MQNDTQATLWPGWETVKLIGRGSFGAVYEIERDVLGDIERAALKVITIPQNESDIDELYSEGYDDESITCTFNSHLKSIVAEYTLMRKMNGCSNVVNCDDIRYIQHDNGIGWDIYIKMELLSALPKALQSSYNEETIITIAKDICSALELCKKHEIIHRDIKPQNIFVSPNGDYKLGDFGIAKTVEKTMGGTKIGTYKYMAPEVYHSQPYGSNADIYSLGLVLYWLMNERRMPFMPLPPEKLKAGIEEEARNRRLNGEPLPAPANGSVKLKEIVLKACAYDPKNRYLSATEMKAALAQLSAGDRKHEEITEKCIAAKNTSVVTTVDCPENINITENTQTVVSHDVPAPPPKKEDEAWRRSEAAHRAWLKSQQSPSVGQPSQKKGCTDNDESFSMLRQSHERWSKTATVSTSEIPTQKTVEPVVSSPTEDWRKSEAAHRAWLNSIKKKDS